MAKATYAKNFRFFTSRGQWVCDKSRAFCGRTHVKLGNIQKLIFLKNANILNPFPVLCVCKIKA